ncbi:TPA: helix-turn-helix transcriptional regulator [Serratia marcescens]|uniref:helix-turn-helix domain-containing protein n=1 Tax=Serratia marcescens TaxID=615 RepID=UPI001660B74F|nr:helix-turn-helix transcriptional regulator [Serratia marcescens]
MRELNLFITQQDKVKEKMREKNFNVSFSGDQKESFQDRLRTIIRGRSLRAVAEAWDVPQSTINNYLYRGSSPRVAVLKKIADAENVELDWLIDGTTDAVTRVIAPEEPKTLAFGDYQGWIDMLEALTPEESTEALRVLKRHGVSLLLSITDQTNIDLIGLTQNRKKAAIMLRHLSDEKIREILQGDAAGTATSTVNIANS